MINMSEVDEFIFNIQNNYAPNYNVYAAYDDKLFNTSQRIINAHAGDTLNPLTK